MRTAFASSLMEIARLEKRLFVVTNDLGYSVLEPFIKKYPNQYLNIGIAEQNMMGVAAGLALSGKIPIVFSIIPFATMRCYEQIRNDICYHNLNVKIVGVGSGLAYGSLGPTHHAIEDIAIMRVLPNMTVICPGDPVETELATAASIFHQGPIYMRIHKKGDPVVHDTKPAFRIGKAIKMSDGKDGTLIATGNMLHTAAEVIKILRKRRIELRLLSMHTIKPIDGMSLKHAVKETGHIFTLEEHNIIGGLGGAVAEVLGELSMPVLFHRFGIQDRFTKEVGSQEFLRYVNSLSIEEISKKIINFVKEN